MPNALACGCAVLAAGAGTRFGRPGEKLTALIAGKPVVQHAIDAACASNAWTCTLIVGAAFERVLTFVDPRRCAVYENAAWAQGMASSIGLATQIHRNDSACLIVLGDQPHVTTSDLNAIIAAHARDPRAIVALRAGGIWGAPVLFPASDFGALSRLRGDAGAKGYAEAQAKRIIFVEASRKDAFSDVDELGDVTLPSARRIRGTRRSPVRR